MLRDRPGPRLGCFVVVCLFLRTENRAFSLYSSLRRHVLQSVILSHGPVKKGKTKRMGLISPRIREYFVLFLRVGLHLTGLSSRTCQATLKGRRGFSRLDWAPWPRGQGSAHRVLWTHAAPPFGCHADALPARVPWLSNQPLSASVLALEYDKKNKTKKPKTNEKKTHWIYLSLIRADSCSHSVASLQHCLETCESLTETLEHSCENNCGSIMM